MQRGEAAVVGLVHVSAVVDQLAHHGVLAIVAGDVQGCVPVDVDFVNLQSRGHQAAKVTGASSALGCHKNLVAVAGERTPFPAPMLSQPLGSSWVRFLPKVQIGPRWVHTTGAAFWPGKHRGEKAKLLPKCQKGRQSGLAGPKHRAGTP